MSKKFEIKPEIMVAYSILVVLAAIATVTSYYIGNGLLPQTDKRTNEDGKSVKSQEYPDFDTYMTGKKLTIVRDQESYVTTDFKIIGEVNDNLGVTGKLDRAYVYIEASVDNGNALTVYDSIYLILNRMGGHVRRDYSLPIPKGGTTKLLFDLRQVPYVESVPYSENNLPLFVNWLDQLNSDRNISLYTFLSSQRSGGMIKEITIGYQCVQNTSCNLELK